MRVSSVGRSLIPGSFAIAAGSLTAWSAQRWMRAHRRSPAVQTWEPSALPRTRIGVLSCAVGGAASRSGPLPVLLLHGLVATGDVFGRAPDRLAVDRPVAVPDLLGFGRSLDPDRTDFGTDAHLEALAAVVDQQFGDQRFMIGAHSMGSGIALRLAAMLSGRVVRVVCLGAPMWSSAKAARESLGAAGPMAKAFMFDERVAGRICAWNCDHRWLAGWLAALGAPRWPVPVSRQASLHTWPSYVGAMEGQVLHDDWPDLLDRLDAADIALRLVWGADDDVGDSAYAQSLADDRACVTVELVPGADHTIPAARPDLLATAFD